MKKFLPSKQNIIFAAVVLLIAAVLLGVQAYQKLQADSAAAEESLYYAEIHVSTSQGNIVIDQSLDEDGAFDLETEWGYTVHLEILDGQIRFVDSPCPDHVCESYGWIGYENQFAICAPSTVTILIVSKDDQVA